MTHPPAKAFPDGHAKFNVLANAEENAGPLTYDPKQTETGREFDMQVRNGVEAMQMAAFASKVPRSDIVLPSRANPGLARMISIGRRWIQTCREAIMSLKLAAMRLTLAIVSMALATTPRLDQWWGRGPTTRKCRKME